MSDLSFSTKGNRMNAINPKQQLFCREYLIDLNAAAAAKRAGYKATTARQQGQRLLTKVYIQEEIAHLMQVRKQRLDLDADKVIQEIAAIAFSVFSDFAHIEDQQLFLKDTSTIPPHILPALAEIKKTTRNKYSTTQVRMHDKVRALELLLRHLGITTAPNQNKFDDATREALLIAAAGYQHLQTV